MSLGCCSTHRCKYVNKTMNKKLPCNDFCGCGPTYENADCVPILENNDFPDNDDEKGNDDL